MMNPDWIPPLVVGAVFLLIFLAVLVKAYREERRRSQ